MHIFATIYYLYSYPLVLCCLKTNHPLNILQLEPFLVFILKCGTISYWNSYLKLLQVRHSIFFVIVESVFVHAILQHVSNLAPLSVSHTFHIRFEREGGCYTSTTTNLITPTVIFTVEFILSFSWDNCWLLINTLLSTLLRNFHSAFTDFFLIFTTVGCFWFQCWKLGKVCGTEKLVVQTSIFSVSQKSIYDCVDKMILSQIHALLLVYNFLPP